MKAPNTPVTLWIATFLWLLTNNAAPAAQSVSIAWDPSPDAAGYFVYWRTDASDLHHPKTDAGTNTQFTIPGIVEGDTCYISVIAYSAEGAESLPATTSFLVPGAIRVERPSSTAPITLRVSAAASSAFDIQATQDFADWTTIGQISACSNEWIFFVDADARTLQQRFYRLTPRF